MKNYVLTLAALALAVFSTTLINAQLVTTIDFETANDGYTPSTTIGTGWEDVFNRTNHDMTIINNEDGYYWAAEDFAGSPYLDLDQIDVSGSTDFTFAIDWIAHHFDDWDDATWMHVTYSLDGGAYQNLLWVETICSCTNAPAAVDLGFDGIGDCGAGTTLPSRSTGTADGCTVAAGNNQFDTYTTAAVPLSSNSTLDIRIQFNFMDQNDQGIYIDNIVITETGGGGGGGNTITTGAITGSPFCVDATTSAGPFNVPFTSTGTFTGGNVYTAQLSDASGSFASPTSIGTLTSTSNSGNVSATIPAGTAAGSGYRIRVISDSPSTIGSNNGSDLVISGCNQIAFQGGEAGDCWSYNASTVSAATISYYNRTGSGSVRAGGGTGCTTGTNCITGGNTAGCSFLSNTITFDDINISAYDGVSLTFYYGNHKPSCSGTGWDSGEDVYFQAKEDGVWQTAVLLQSGFSDLQIDYLQHTYAVPAGTEEFAWRIYEGSPGGTFNRSDEFIYVDDVELTYTNFNGGANASVVSSTVCQSGSFSFTGSATGYSGSGITYSYQWQNNGSDIAGATSSTYAPVATTFTSGDAIGVEVTANTGGCALTDGASNTINITVFGQGGTPGLWQGSTDTDWCDCFNWDDGHIPTAATDVTINQTASNNCEVGTGCGSAVANSVTISTSNNTNNLLTIVNNGDLTISNDLTINKTGGTGILIVETTGTGSLTVGGNVTIDGSTGQNGVLSNNSGSATLDVNGNLVINANGSLDLNASGTLNLAGDFTNNYNNAAAFDHISSTIIFDGGADQDINSAMTSESFNNLTLSKSGGTLLLNDNINLVSAGILALSDDQIQLNGNELTLNNTGTGAITRTSGSIVDESGSVGGNNTGKINWVINTVGGNHVFPFADGVGGTYIPFTFARTAGNAGTVSVSTYGTPANNQPWPNSPDNVNNLASTTGLSPDNRDATADRFWQIDPSGSPTATMTFGYDITELPVAPYNNAATMIAQRYDTGTNEWDETIFPGQTTGSITGGYTVTVPGITTFSPWTLSNSTSPLPAELTVFEAKKNVDQVDLMWVTESEINVSHFIIERSKDGINFHSVLAENAAGNSTSTIEYSTTDYYPLNGKSYYRLKTVDFDGSYKLSPTRVVQFADENVSVINDVNDWNILYKTSSDFYTVNVYNNLGQIVKTAQVENTYENRTIVSHYDLPAGTYIMIVEDNGINHTVKLIK